MIRRPSRGLVLAGILEFSTLVVHSEFLRNHTDALFLLDKVKLHCVHLLLCVGISRLLGSWPCVNGFRKILYNCYNSITITGRVLVWCLEQGLICT